METLDRLNSNIKKDEIAAIERAKRNPAFICNKCGYQTLSREGLIQHQKSQKCVMIGTWPLPKISRISIFIKSYMYVCEI